MKTTPNKPATDTRPAPIRPAILRPADAATYIGMRSRTAIYELVKEGELPQPIKLGARASGFRLVDLDAFIERRMAMAAGA